MKSALPWQIAVAFLFVSLPSQARADSIRESRISSPSCYVNGRRIEADEEASCWRDAYDGIEETTETGAADVTVAGAATAVVEFPSPVCLVAMEDEGAGCEKEMYNAAEEGAEAAAALAAFGGAIAVCGESMGLGCFTVPWAARQYYKEADEAFRAGFELQACLSKKK
jgi:hypothetical protein